MQKWRNLLGVSLTALSLAASASVAHATEGYFLEGASARDQGLAGIDSANPGDSLTIANNPAGLVDVGRQFNGDVSVFMPWRGYDATGTMLVAPGSVDSYRNAFVLPALGYSNPISADQAWGVGMVGNGGMNTSYSAGIMNPRCPPPPYTAGSGVFCGGRTGVDLNQGLIYFGYAQRFGNLSVGIAPVVGVQIFSAYGLGAFNLYGLSSAPAYLTDHSPAWSAGVGVRAGAIYKVSPDLSFSVQGSTPIWSSNFTDYQGLFAQQGSFNIPGTVGAGLSYKVMPTLAMMVDWKHIFYSGVASISNPMTPLIPGSFTLGSSIGEGFGWKDVDVIGVSFEWAYSDHLTLRAGYSYSTQPITAANVMMNILAPGTVTSHVGAGFSYLVTPNSAIDFAALYSPRASVSGQEYLPGYGYNPYSNINIWLSELQLTLGYTYHWDTPRAVIAKY
jgi:long-chain fatty acid transport protein